MFVLKIRKCWQLHTIIFQQNFVNPLKFIKIYGICNNLFNTSKRFLHKPTLADTFQKTFTRNKTHRHFLYIQCADLIGLPIKQEINQICMYKVLLASLLGEFDSTSEIPFMFKRAGCDVDIFCASGSWLRSNKFHDKWIETTEIHEDFKTRLLKLVESNPEYYNWIVLLDDAAIRLMNEEINSEYLFKKILPLTKIENREMLSSKIGLSKICEKYSIATPRFINYSDEHDIEKISQKY